MNENVNEVKAACRMELRFIFSHWPNASHNKREEIANAVIEVINEWRNEWRKGEADEKNNR